jgi:hypothetical protein
MKVKNKREKETLLHTAIKVQHKMFNTFIYTKL